MKKILSYNTNLLSLSGDVLRQIYSYLEFKDLLNLDSTHCQFKPFPFRVSARSFIWFEPNDHLEHSVFYNQLGTRLITQRQRPSSFDVIDRRSDKKREALSFVRVGDRNVLNKNLPVFVNPDSDSYILSNYQGQLGVVSYIDNE